MIISLTEYLELSQNTTYNTFGAIFGVSMAEGKGLSHAPAVDRALNVIEIIAASDRELSLSELLGHTNIPKQSLIRILKTLCERGFVDRGSNRGFYRLGMNILYLGSRMQEKMNLRSVALPFMQELAHLTHKAVELATMDRDQLFLIDRIEGTEGIRFYSRVGVVYPYFHAVCAGKIYLAHMDAEKRRKALSKIGLPAVTEYTLTDLNELEKDLAGVRKNGYAFEDQELRIGLRRIAAPIYNLRDELVGSINLAASVSSFGLKDKDTLGRMVMDTANKISSEMGQRREG